jgi:Ca-activated chloride channel homolog
MKDINIKLIGGVEHMSQNLTFSYSFLQKYLPITGMNQMYVLFELNGRGEASSRPPINLSVVLDRSGSMRGAPLHYCKEATKFVINQLQDEDVLNVVVFDDHVKTVLPPQELKHKDQLKLKIDQIVTGGMTNLSGGLIQGCQHLLCQNTDQYVNRLILLSDGQANRGITDTGQLLNVVDDFQNAGAIISTMGVSDHFNEELMEAIAEHGKGNYYYINEVEEIPEIFSRELKGLLSIVAQNININILPHSGVQVKKCYGYMTQQKDDTVRLSLGDMYSNELKSILVEFSYSDRHEGIHDLFDIEWSFVDVTNGVKDCRFRQNIPAEFTADIHKLSAGLSASVEKQVEITKSAEIIEEAMRLFDNGNIEMGKVIISNQAARMAEKAHALKDMELMEESQALYKQLEKFDYSKQKRKELHQEKYRQMKIRKKENNFVNPVSQKLNLLKQYMDDSRYTAIFTGAGISTEAGLPDFRSADSGLWNDINPLELASTKAMKQNRKAFIDFYRHRVQGLTACQPHTGHYLLSKWEREGKIQSIITQNVDGFHHAAGNKRIEELHGTLRTCHCNQCGLKYPIERFMEEELICECGGFIRPSVVLFGEALPGTAVNNAEKAAEKADLFIVLGSSLSVSPANHFPIIAKQRGAKLVIINMEKTDLDAKADIVINGEKIGRLLEQLN